jgi:hypothetical protein
MAAKKRRGDPCAVVVGNDNRFLLQKFHLTLLIVVRNIHTHVYVPCASQQNRYLNKMLKLLFSAALTMTEYEEFKKLILFGGATLMIIIVFILFKLQIPTEMIFKWSPVVWLIGIIFCGLCLRMIAVYKKVMMRTERTNSNRNYLTSNNNQLLIAFGWLIYFKIETYNFV